MKALDTNVLARFFINDPDDAQAHRQRAKATEVMSGVLFVSTSVLLEFEWVMRGFYELSSRDINAVLVALCSLQNVTLESKEAVLTAVDWHRHGLDFADGLHLAVSHRCEALLTFDKKFARKAARLKTYPKVELLVSTST